MTSLLLRFSKASRRTTVPPTILLPANARRRQRNGNAHSLKIQAIGRATMQFFLLAKVNEFSKSHFGCPLRNDNNGAEKTNEPRPSPNTRISQTARAFLIKRPPIRRQTIRWPLCAVKKTTAASKNAHLRSCSGCFPSAFARRRKRKRCPSTAPSGRRIQNNRDSKPF